MVSTVATILVWVAFLVKIPQLFRAPDDRLLRAVALGLGSATIAFTVGRHPVELFLDGLVLGLPTLIRNLGMTGAFAAIAAFFVHATQPPPAAVRAMRRHTAILVGLVALMTAIWAVMPAEARPDPRDGSAGGKLFLIVAAIGTLYAAAVAARYTVRTARTVQLPRVRRGLAILSVGLIGSVAINLLSVSSSLGMLIVPRDHPAIGWTGPVYVVVTLIAIPGIAIGLAYPIVAAMGAAIPTWWRHRQEYRAMAPLWRQVRTAWPDVLLRRPAGALRPGIHTRRYRRATEIRDALVLMQPYYPVRRAEMNGDVHEYAADLDEALRLRAEALDDGSYPVGGTPSGSAPAVGNHHIDGDVDWLVKLSRALVQHQKTPAS